MAKYTIEVDTLYVLSILAPLAEFLEGELDEAIGLYLVESLSCLLSELNSSDDMMLEGSKDAWLRIAKLSECFAGSIRHHFDKTG